MNKLFSAFALSLICAALFSSCCNDKMLTTPGDVVVRTDWAPEVKQGINDFIATYRNTPNAYAVFDFDNTTSIFDIESNMCSYQLENMAFAMTPETFTTIMSRGLESTEGTKWATDISTAYNHLYESYGPFTSTGVSEDVKEKLTTDKWWKEFATKMRGLYDNVDDVFAGTEEIDEWCKSWLVGMTPDEVYQMACKSDTENSRINTTQVTWQSPTDISSQTGSKTVIWTKGLQVTENMKELYKALHDNGIDVWICSASSIEPVKAAADVFGLRDYVKGVTAMTIATGSDGKYDGSYDYNGKAEIPDGSGWKNTSYTIGCKTTGIGKVQAINNAISPQYGSTKPLAGFMDSTGDFNFCTEFDNMKFVICFNRANRKITDGGGVISEVAMYEKESLGYTSLAIANANGDTYYVLQGRDENGLRSFRASNKTIRIGETEEKLFANEDNHKQLTEMQTLHLTVGEAIDKYSKGFLKEYAGYHNIK